MTAPLRSNLVAVGAGAVHVWVKASAPSVDLQATVSEVRPDGYETFVQSGWLRANERTLDASQSTLLEPVPTYQAKDVRPLPAGRYTEVTIPLYYEGHAYRRRLPDSPDDLRARRRPADLGVRADPPVAPRQGLDRPLPRDAVTPRPADRPRRAGADGSAAVPGSARGAVPAVQALSRHGGAARRLSLARRPVAHATT